MSPREEEQVEKESKRRIIQHRLSRKNSLTLLQIQGLTENSKGHPKKLLLSSFGKKHKITDSRDECIQIDAVDSDVHSESDI